MKLIEKICRPKIVFCSICFIAFQLNGVARAQTRDLSSFGPLLQQIKDSLQFSGVLLVANNDRTLLSYSNGYASLENQTKHSVSNTKFRLASISKTMVSYVIYILKSQGRLAMDDKITKYLKELDEEIYGQITIEQLIQHKSGIIRALKNITKKNTYEPISPIEIFYELNQAELMFPPGTQRSYSNVGYSLLAILIERITGMDFYNAIRNILFDPLKMFNTNHEIDYEVISNIAQGYNLVGDKIFRSRLGSKSWILGAGSIYSTATDLLRFSKEVQKGTLLDSLSHTQYLKDLGNYTTHGGWTTYGYGAKLANAPKKGRLIMHGGVSPGYRSDMHIFLDHGITLICLSNQAPLPISILYNKIGNVALGYEPEQVLEPQLTKLFPDIEIGNITDAILKYNRATEESDSIEKIKHHEVNNLGYLLLETNNVASAVNVFKFGVTLFPENANLYDSLGEALALKRDFANALKAYQKSISLDSTNVVGKRAIRKIENELNKH